jgi:Na+/H+-dicarboxylate symporter
MKLWQKVTLGLILGIICGVFFPAMGEYVKPIGTIFLRLIKMVIAPVIFFALVSGITSMSDPETFKRVGIKSVVAFVVATCFAVMFGVGVALLFEPGSGVQISFDSVGERRGVGLPKPFNLWDFVINIFPDNAMAAMVNCDMLQVVFLAVFTGMTLNKMGSVAAPVISLFHTFSKVVLRMIGAVVHLSPYAAFGLTTWVISAHGVEILFGLSKLVISVVVAMMMQYAIFGIMIMLFCRISPMQFYRKSIHYQVLAFSTSSSKAALPVTMQVCRDEIGLSESSTSFVLPLGASLNMSGMAINLGLTSIFFAQMLGIELSMHDYVMIVFTGTVGSIGGAGIPGASLIMLPIVLASAGIPVDGVAILAGVDRILDMLRTTINLTGDAAITLIIDNSEGTFDKERYYS